MSRKKTCFGASDCDPKLVSTAQAQASKLLKEAQGKRHFGCGQELSAAKEAFDKAKGHTGTVLQRRNAFIRATYLAGQAKACVVVAGQPRRKRRRRKAGGKS